MLVCVVNTASDAVVYLLLCLTRLTSRNIALKSAEWNVVGYVMLRL